MGRTICNLPRARRPRGQTALGAIAAASALCAVPACAAEAGPLEISATYAADVVAVIDGPARGVRHVDLLTVPATLDLAQAAGWRGTSLHATIQAETGGEPNALAGTLEGINNSEVAQGRLRLFEFYLEQELPALKATAKAGFINLNADFYASNSAALLLAPPFGIGSELAATGPNGPSIYPSTAPTIALSFRPGAGTYVQLAAVNAEAGAVGDPGGPPPLLRQGALLIAEAGRSGRGKLALGAWAYTRRQDDLFAVDGAGAPVRRAAHGAYLLVEQPLGSERLTGFLRAGLSDGRTGAFRGAWQAGFLLEKFLAARPAARLSVGLHQGVLGGAYRASMAAAGDPQRPAETGWEVTYEDQLAPWLKVQPDVQFIRTPSRAADSRDAVVLALRLTFTPPGQD